MTDEPRDWWPSRSAQRAVHLLLATIMGISLSSPLRSVEGRDAILQVIVCPLLAVSGVLLWKRHAVRHWLRDSRLTGADFPQSLFVLLCVGFLFGLGGHVDHISLLISPFVGLGLYLGWRTRVGIRYWTVLFVVLAALVVTQHPGATASGPPGDVIGPYESELLGLTAFAWLLVFTGVVLVTAASGGVPWYRRRTGPSARWGIDPGE